MRQHLAFAETAAAMVLRLRLRSFVIVICLAGILAPFLVATAIFEGVRAESAVSIEEGADLYVSANKAGRNAVIATSWLEEVRSIPGVERVVPRIVGRDYIVGPVVVVGLPLGALPAAGGCLEGRPPGAPNEAVVGHELAAELNLAVGKSFTLNVNPGVRLEVSGLFQRHCPHWSSRAVFVALGAAQEIFAMEGEATEILLYVKPGYAEPVFERLQLLAGADVRGVPLRVVSKRIAREMLRRGFSRRAGIFSALYLVAFAIAIPTIAVASGLGFSDRRREVGLYRAAGWQTHEVLELVSFENLILSLAGATLALAVSMLWMKLLNGFFIAQFFLPEVGVVPGFVVTTRFLPLPALLAYLLALTLTLVGSLYSTWKIATLPPMEAIR